MISKKKYGSTDSEVSTSEPKSMTDTKPAEKQEWIYKSKAEKTIILKGTTYERRLDPTGIPRDVPDGPIKVKFTHNTFVLNEATAKRMKRDLKYIVELMEESPFNGPEYKLIWGPGFVPDKGLLKYAAESDELADSKIIVMHGARATGHRGR
ncbi:MAG: hypothetical protein U9N61_08090 [Euryarchaeota archaeon]|nr:hypothetical protein [Euryarchaeota archaeon]